MAQKKTGTKSDEKSLNEAAEELKKAAEMLSRITADASPAEAKPKAKSSTAKKSTSTAKKPAVKSGTSAAKKPAVKSGTSAAKKPAAKKAPAKPKEEAVEPVVAEEPAPAPQPEPAPAPEPVPEPTPEPTPAPQPEPAPEPEPAPAPAPVAEEKPASAPPPKAEVAAAAEPAEEKPAKKQGILGKIKDFLDNKGKFPIFIAVNALFLVSAILLLFAAYEDKPNGTINVFQYFTRAAKVKAFLVNQAVEWADAAYVIIGILMILCMFVPLALMIKNIILFVKKKKVEVYKSDAIIYFATMLGLVSMVNLYGAYISAGQVISLIISIVIFVFTVFTLLLSQSNRALPVFSIVNIVLAFIALMLLTYYVYEAKNTDNAWCIAGAIGDPNIKLVGFVFLLMLITVAAMLVLVIMQIKRLPGAIGHIVEIAIPLAAAACSLIALIIVGASNPSKVTIGTVTVEVGVSAGFIVGVIFTLLIAIADTLFTFLAPLQKYKVMVEDAPAIKEKPAKPAKPAKAAPAAAAPAAQPEAPAKVFCVNCGTENSPDSMFCYKCGNKLQK